MKILITGGTGYLGQFLVKELASGSDPAISCHVALTYSSKKPSEEQLSLLGPSNLDLKAYKVDFRTGDGLDECLQDFGQVDVVVNCAAISVPRDCERDPEAAFQINVPSQLLSRLSSSSSCSPLFIHLSTDQVYDGSRSFWREGDATEPVNAYGRTKVAAEQAVREALPQSHLILRSSIIVGPAPPIALAKGLPLQWMDQTLAASAKSGQPANFFSDEFRCPVFVHDLVTVVKTVVARTAGGESFHHTLNAGGPDRLSRAAMAAAVARHRGYPLTAIREQPAASAVGRGVASPPDISMDISALKSLLALEPTSYEEAVRLTLT